MGFFLSRAKTQELDNREFLKLILLLFSLAIPMLIHGCYDFLLSDQVAVIGYRWFFYIYVALLDLFAWKIIRHEFKTDHRL